MRISLTRAVAGTAIAAVAVLAAAGTASATTTPPPPAPTTLSISAASSTIALGQRDTISGTLLTGTTPVAKRVIWLDRVSSTGKLIAVQARLTDKAGDVNYVVAPKATVTYELVFRGGPKYAAANSATLTVTVTAPVKLPTTLSIVESKTSIHPGGRDTISGTLMSGKVALAKKLIWLYRVTVKGTLIPVQVELTGPAGKVHFLVKPKVTSAYALAFKGTAKYAATHSGIVIVVVK